MCSSRATSATGRSSTSRKSTTSRYVGGSWSIASSSIRNNWRRCRASSGLGCVRSTFDGCEERRAVLPRRPVTCFVTHDGADPAARGRRASILVELLQHEDPAVLQSIVCGRIVTGDPSGHGEEPRRAAPKPRLGIAVEQRTPSRFLDSGKPRRVGHRWTFCKRRMRFVNRSRANRGRASRQR